MEGFQEIELNGMRSFEEWLAVFDPRTQASVDWRALGRRLSEAEHNHDWDLPKLASLLRRAGRANARLVLAELPSDLSESIVQIAPELGEDAPGWRLLFRLERRHLETALRYLDVCELATALQGADPAMAAKVREALPANVKLSEEPKTEAEIQAARELVGSIVEGLLHLKRISPLEA